MPLRCCVCGAPFFAAAPGSDPAFVRSFPEGLKKATHFGPRPIAWCKDHWPWLKKGPTPENKDGVPLAQN